MNYIMNSVKDSVMNSVRDSSFGQHDAFWMGFYDYFATVCRLKDQTKKLAGIMEISQSAGWWYPCNKICWVSERHNLVNRDDLGRLHCTDGPALSYPDGWSIYSIGGVRLNEQVVMSPQTQTIEDVRNENNEEIKRIRIERFAGKDKTVAEGWARYLKEVGASVVDKRSNYAENTKEALMRSSDGLTTLVCACPSTGRVYALEVPASVSTCEEAQVFLWSGSQLVERTKKISIIGRS